MPATRTLAGRQARRFVLAAAVAQLLGCAAATTEAPAARADLHPFAAAIEATRARLDSAPHAHSTEAATQATEAFLSGLIDSAWHMAHAARHLGTPSFAASREVEGLPGLFNPDNRYSSALLDPEGRYRISGTRGSHTRFTLQFLDAIPLIGLSKGLAVIDFDERGLQPGGSFAVRIGGTEAQADGEPWWPMPEGARAVLSRQTFSDWVNETPTRIRIERLDDAQPTPNPVQAVLAADYLERMTTLWADRYLAGLERLPENIVPPIRASANEAGGLAGQQGAIARYHVRPDEALLITVRASDAAYQSIQVGGYWFATQHPLRHQSSLSRPQAHVDSDGILRFVLSHRDPGVANWLDLAGEERGYLMIRWQGIRTPLTTQDQPRAKRVQLTDLDSELPNATARVTPAERAQQLASRRHLPARKP